VHDPERARRFRDAALPHLDEVYTLARYLLRSGADADDAVQECYLRALKHFDTFRGGAIRPWLFAILRNVCNSSYSRRSFAGPDEAIVLREVNDLSYSEIAEIVGAPIGTVMSRLARGRSMLRAAWLSAEGKE
jgi:RNA polymerase sigma-70 factor (ECF subfamily)